MKKLTIKTIKEKQVIDLTDKINDIVAQDQEIKEVCHLFLTHTTAALTTALVDPESELDLTNIIQVALPAFKQPEIAHGLEHTHYVTHVPNHVIASFLGPSLVIPVENRKMVLGKLQRVVLVEFNGPKNRQIVIK